MNKESACKMIRIVSKICRNLSSESRIWRHAVRSNAHTL